MILKGLAVSNIAWPNCDLEEALRLLPTLGLRGMEIAPCNVFGRWDVAADEVREIGTRLADHGLLCPSLQGILFEVPEARLFGGGAARRALVEQLDRVARIAGLLGAGACVFGAPKQRDPGELSPAAAWAEAVAFFRSVGPMFADRGTSLAIEANARNYGCRFIITTAEAVALVREVDAPGISVQIDTGTIFLEGEDPAVLAAAAPLAVHAHVSEPDLRSLGATDLDHRPVAEALKASGYIGWLSIEMRSSPNWANSVREASALLQDIYQ